MLKGQIYSKNTIFFSRLFSILLSPIYSFLNLFRSRYQLENIKIKKILVTEYHRIGDVLIIAPILKSLKLKFPTSHLILVCNQDVRELAFHLNLADEIISINAPWTNWDWSFLSWLQVRAKAKELSSKKIDIAFDFKGDIRNAWFLWHTHPKISFGYNTTGGSYFFTNSMKMNQNLHQSERAFTLISNLGCQFPNDKEQDWSLNENGAIVIHVGSSDKRRSWPLKHWLELVDYLSKDFDVVLVDVKEAKQLIEQTESFGVKLFKGDLIQFKIWLSYQKCLIAPDSMAGHLAAYAKIPVITIFGSQNPKLTSPKTNKGLFITPEEKCYHNRNHWRLCSECMKSITPKMVYKRFFNFIHEVNNY